MNTQASKETFNDIINGNTPVLVDFYADWCGPCQMMQPILQQLHDKKGDQLRILKLNVDKNPAAAAAYCVQGVPTFILFRKGQLLWRQSGAMSLPQIEGFIDQHLG